MEIWMRIQRFCMDVQCFTGKLQEPNKTLGRCMDVWLVVRSLRMVSQPCGVWYQPYLLDRNPILLESWWEKEACTRARMVDRHSGRVVALLRRWWMDGGGTQRLASDQKFKGAVSIDRACTLLFELFERASCLDFHVQDQNRNVMDFVRHMSVTYSHFFS